MSNATATVDRVPLHTAPEVNERIREQTTDDVALYARADPELIEKRLDELDHEWASERVLETNASALILLGTLMAALRGRRWLLLPAVVAGFLLQHAIQGWCPPLAVIRRAGFRTEHEIDAERAALLRVLMHPEETDDPKVLLKEAGWTT